MSGEGGGGGGCGGGGYGGKGGGGVADWFWGEANGAVWGRVLGADSSNKLYVDTRESRDPFLEGGVCFGTQIFAD